MSKQETIKNIQKNFASRVKFERTKNNDDNANIFKALNDAKNKMLNDNCVSYLSKYRVNADFVNLSKTKSSRFNVKAIVKVARTMQAIMTKDVSLLDNHTRRVLFQIKHLKQDRAFKYDEMKSMQSTRVTTSLSTKLNDKLRSTYSAATCSTQTSSTMQMLRALKLTDKDDKITIDDNRLSFIQSAD